MFIENNIDIGFGIPTPLSDHFKKIFKSIQSTILLIKFYTLNRATTFYYN